MRRVLFLILCVAALASASPAAQAQGNPLVGTWRGNVAGSDGRTSGVATYIFTADGHYAFIANGIGDRGAFTLRTEGRYQIVGPGQTVWVMDSYSVCTDAAATACQPYPNAEIGRQQPGVFQMNGPNQLTILGTAFRRVS
jgi:hypothetical protein